MFVYQRVYPVLYHYVYIYMINLFCMPTKYVFLHFFVAAAQASWCEEIEQNDARQQLLKSWPFHPSLWKSWWQVYMIVYVVWEWLVMSTPDVMSTMVYENSGAIPPMLWYFFFWYLPNETAVWGLLIQGWHYPIGSMYGIYANIGGILMVNVT